MEFPDGRLAIDYKDEIMQFEKWFLEEMADIKDKGRMFTVPSQFDFSAEKGREIY